MPADLILALARTRRCAIVATGTPKAAGDLVGRQPGHAPQRERDARLDVERRMAAGEDQAQAVVVDARRPAILGDARSRRSRGRAAASAAEPLACRASRLAADPVERPPAGDRVDPAGRVGRPAVDRPAFGRQQPCVLEAVLGQRRGRGTGLSTRRGRGPSVRGPRPRSVHVGRRRSAVTLRELHHVVGPRSCRTWRRGSWRPAPGRGRGRRR